MTPPTLSLSLRTVPLLLAALLASCGGSGDSGGASSNTPYQGTLLNGTKCTVRYYAQSQPRQSAGTDPLYLTQWYLKNTGRLTGYSGLAAGEDLQVENVWASGLRGENIRVAVVDDALEVTHQDLAPNVAEGASYNYVSDGSWQRGSPWPLPCTSSQTHGTAVGGVVAARDGNGLGGRGVAPRASLVGYNLLAFGDERNILDALSRDIDRNHIFNNSWGPEDDGQLNKPASGWTAFNDTLAKGLSKGRNGLGVLYVFSGGNGGWEGDYSSADSTASSRGAITVCATDAAGERAPYSERGSNLTVCAPSGRSTTPATAPEITTTAVKDKYTDDFGGTSASAPMVSGVAALMLQANPRLTWRDVPLILARTARQVDARNGGWSELRSPQAGVTGHDVLRYSHHYGFGVVDAEAATRLARSWQSVGGSSTQKQCGPFTTRVNAPIPEADAVATNPVRKSQAEAFRKALIEAGNRIDYNQAAPNGLSSTVSVPESCQITHIEHIEVTLTATNADGIDEHPSAGDLHITLQSPLGSVSTLSVPHPCQLPADNGSMQIGPCQGLQNYPFGVRRHLEEPVAQGSNRYWTLSATDRVAGETGRLKDWSITFYGR